MFLLFELNASMRLCVTCIVLIQPQGHHLARINQIQSLFITAQPEEVEFVSITVTFCGHKTAQHITGTVLLEQLGVKCLVQGHNCDDS